MLTIRPVVAQNVVTLSDEVREHSEDVVRLKGLEPDRTQVADRWELVTDANDPALGDLATTTLAERQAELSNFPDYRLFTIDRMSGDLTFKTPPDYEDPQSVYGADAATLVDKNVYKVKAKFGDGEKFLPVEVTVRVTGIEEKGYITLSNRRPEVDEPLTATLADPDKGTRTPNWQWQVETGVDTGVFEDIPNAVNRKYTPKAGDEGKYLKATAKYQDGHDTDKAEEEAMSEFVVRAVPSGTNEAPEFADEPDGDAEATGDQYGRRIEENAAPGTKVGPPVFATDDNHRPAGDPGGEPRDELTYSLRDPTNDPAVTGNDSTADDDNDINTDSDGDGHAALFKIDQATGQKTTRVPLDHESLANDTAGDAYRYKVVVRATDPSGGTADMNLTIHVLDVEETPQLTGPAALTYFENRADGDNQLVLYRDPEILHTDTANDPLRVVYMATDNDLDNDGDTIADLTEIQWELTGDDADKFQFGLAESDRTYTDSLTIVGRDTTATTPRPLAIATSPVLRFEDEPDVEEPGDVGGIRAGDNIYEITVRAWDEDWLIGERHVTIVVADRDDEGMITFSHIQPQQGVKLTATLSDPDGISGTPTWKWESPVGTDATGTVTSSGLTSTYTPVVGTDTDILTVTVEYDDRGPESGKRTVMAETDNAVRAATPPTGGENEAPTFYTDTVPAADPTADPIPIVLTNADHRVSDNETSRYVRYVLEGQHPRNVALTDSEAQVYDETSPPLTGNVKVYDGYLTTAGDDTSFTADGNGFENLQFSLSGSGADYFEILHGDDPATAGVTEPVGLIRTKKALDFETTSTYTLTVTATDPSGGNTGTSTATVVVNVLDQAEISGIPGDEKRVWVNESLDPENDTVVVDTVRAENNPSHVSQGGFKWSLLTTNPTDPLVAQAHNRYTENSVDCQLDPLNEDLCDDFRVYPSDTASTQLLFALGKDEDHFAPDFEDPKDIAGVDGPEDADTTAPDQAANDNIYQVVVRVAFATLRSDGTALHPNPQADEMEERTYVVRVVDVDEAPSFSGSDSEQSTNENSDDDLPSIEINKDLGGSVRATDPEYENTLGFQSMKKLTFSLNFAPEAEVYSDMFQIVPSTGEILTKSRIDYEALDLEEHGTPGGHYKTITGVSVTATDSAPVIQTLVNSATMPTWVMSDSLSATLPVSINIRDENETPVPAEPLVVAGKATVVDYGEGQEDTTVGTYTVTGDNRNSADWSLSGADEMLFELADGENDRERVLKFKAAPDYEMPRGKAFDANNNTNVYMVTIEVQATDDATDTTSIDVTITVINVEEDGTVTLDSMQPSVGAPIMAMLEDMDGVTSVVWQWASHAAPADGTMPAADSTDWADISGATDASYTPVTGDAGMYLRATATYDDGFDSGNVEMAVASYAVAHVVITEGPTAVSYMENDTADVGTYTAQSAGIIDWTVRGTDYLAFSIEAGVLSFNASPNYEVKSEYMVTVVAMASGAEDSEDVTVTITDQDDPTSVTLSDTTGIMVGDTLTATLVDEDGATATWQWSRSATMDGTYANITDANSAMYEVANADAGMYLMATASYTDSFGSGTASSDAVMVQADVVARYDTDNDGNITVSELLGAIDAYFDDVISLADLSEVIDAYFNG